MQKLLSPAAAAICLLAVTPAAAAEIRAEARLAAPRAQPVSFQAGGYDWRCEGQVCQGAAERRRGVDGFMRECRKVSAELGPLTSYVSRGRTMTPGNLKACNRAARVETTVQIAAE